MRRAIAGRVTVRLAPVAALVSVLVPVVVAAGLVGGCGGDAAAPGPRVGLIEAAMAAVDEARGGGVEYFEVNADPQAVNLFVASDDGATVTGYLYVDGELVGPAPSREVESGFVFTSADVDIDPDRVLGQVAEQLPDSEIGRFVITGTDQGVPRYEAIVLSDRGGALVVVLTATGDVLSVIPA